MRVITSDNGYAQCEASGLDLAAATKLAESYARRVFGAEWQSYRRKGGLPAWCGHGYMVEVRR